MLHLVLGLPEGSSGVQFILAMQVLAGTEHKLPGITGQKLTSTMLTAPHGLKYALLMFLNNTLAVRTALTDKLAEILM